jgi:hypothetical protein
LPSEISHPGRALAIAELVTGIEAETLARTSRLELLDPRCMRRRLASGRWSSIRSLLARRRCSLFGSPVTIHCRWQQAAGVAGTEDVLCPQQPSTRGCG